MTTVRERIELDEDTGRTAVLTMKVAMAVQPERPYAVICMKGRFCVKLGSVCQEGYCDNCIIHED